MVSLFLPDQDMPREILNQGNSPGRFLAVHEIKIMFARLLLRYDWKLARGTKPEPFFIATMCIPDTKLKVLFRQRS